MELRALMHALVHDRDYQNRLRGDFCRRKVHPTTEVAVWNRVLGPSTQTIPLSAELTLDARLAEERELFSRLSIVQREQLAAESQALVDRARAMLQGQHAQPARTLPVAAVGASLDEKPLRSPGPELRDGVDVCHSGMPARCLDWHPEHLATHIEALA